MSIRVSSLSCLLIFLSSCISADKQMNNKTRSIASTLSTEVKFCKDYFSDEIALFAKSIDSDSFFGRSKTNKEIEIQNENINFSHKYIYMEQLLSSLSSNITQQRSSELSDWGYELGISNAGIDTRIENLFSNKSGLSTKLKTLFNSKATESDCYTNLASTLSEKIVAAMDVRYVKLLSEYLDETRSVKEEIEGLENDLNNANFNQLSVALGEKKSGVISTYVQLASEMKNRLNSDIAERVLHLDFKIRRLNEKIKRVSLPVDTLVEKMNEGNNAFRRLSLSFISQSFIESKYKIDLNYCDNNDCRLIKTSACNVGTGSMANDAPKRIGVVYESGDNAPQKADDFTENCTVSMNSVANENQIQFLYIELINKFKKYLESEPVFYEKSKSSVNTIAHNTSELREYIPLLTDAQQSLLRSHGQKTEDMFDLRGVNRGAVGGASIGGTSFGRLGSSVIVFVDGEAKKAKNLFGDFYFAYVEGKKKFVVIEKNSLKGLVVPSDTLYAFNIQLQKYEKEKNNYSKTKKVVGGLDMAGSVVGTGLVGLGRILINGSHTAYNKFASIVEENTSKKLPRVKSQQTIGDAFRNTWTYLSNKTKTRKSKRQTKELQKQIANQTLIHQLKSVDERKIIENLLGTQDYITHVILAKDQAFGDNLKKHIRELEAKIPTMNVYSSIVSTLPPQ